MTTYADSYDEKVKRAKRWGATHGYVGARGGWIYRTTPAKYGHRPVCQGWVALFARYRRDIERWEAALAVEAQQAAAPRANPAVVDSDSRRALRAAGFPEAAIRAFHNRHED